jgi:hypothetical protein
MGGNSEEAFRIVKVNGANIDECGLFCLQSKKNTEGYKNKVEWAKARAILAHKASHGE